MTQTTQPQFTERDLRNVQAYVKALEQSGARYARMGEVCLYTTEWENDTLLVGDACIMIGLGETMDIIKRPCITYSVQVPYTIPGGYWEPDETDFQEVANVDSLFDAVAQLYLTLADQYCRDIAMAVAYEMDNEVLEEV